MNKYLIPILIISCTLYFCKKTNPAPFDTTPPYVILSSPVNGSSSVPLSTELFIEYNEDIVLSGSYQITLNGNPVIASKFERKIQIQANLLGNTSYTLLVSDKSVKDIAGNYAPAFSLKFSTGSTGATIFEAENAVLSNGLSIQSSIQGYSGTGYVGSFTSDTDSLVFELHNIPKSAYNLYIQYSTSNWGSKNCRVLINGSGGDMELPSSTGFIRLKFGKVKLLEGDNRIVIKPNWTYFIIDRIEIEVNTDSEIAFNISSTLVSPNPSLQAVNLYNFLKDNFQTKIISGTMAAHATNINEAQWVFDQTGKWPALTGFDFIDYTNLGQNWIDYDAIYNLGSDWWANNGLLTIMWHWRDPLTKSGSFYTNETTFDVSKISDIGSPEYIAMIEDIDTIAGYLREFRDANIPVIWRPLHEAAGGWFWWGAKGSVPCKELWQIMFARLVNYHGLNNLIWVWTTNTNSDALDWYPGDAYVDIIGMDIYPGTNQHGSQYPEFDKAKEIFQGKKILTLSECGSVPDPALMMEYGDTWSWFMPWNGDFTRSTEHNGPAWWNKLFTYDYVITRDQMPDLN